jgi:hypothetical protein
MSRCPKHVMKAGVRYSWNVAATSVSESVSRCRESRYVFGYFDAFHTSKCLRSSSNYITEPYFAPFTKTDDRPVDNNLVTALSETKILIRIDGSYAEIRTGIVPV